MAHRDSTARTPRWVWVSGIIAIVVVLALIIVAFASGGSHGPGRHAPDHQPAGPVERDAPVGH